MFAGPGSCVLIYKEDIEGNDVPLVIHISGWRGTTSLRCYMSQHSTVHLLRLLGGDISKYDVNKFKKLEEDEEEASKEEDKPSGDSQ
jgi:tRNA (cytosine34-C5)-methyltransferase